MGAQARPKGLLEEEQCDREDGSGYEERCDERAVAAVAIGHVETGEGGGEEAEGDQEEEELQGQGVVGFGGPGGWLELLRRGRGLGDGRREFFDWSGRELLFVDLGEGDDPGRGFVGAATGGLVKAEGLERAGEGEEEQRRSDEDAEVEVSVAGVVEKGTLRWHMSFLHKISI